MKLTQHKAHMGETRNSYKILDGQPEGTKLQKPTHRWEDNIKVAHKDTG
jgi:hypothetical protein